MNSISRDILNLIIVVACVITVNAISDIGFWSVPAGLGVYIMVAVAWYGLYDVYFRLRYKRWPDN